MDPGQEDVLGSVGPRLRALRRRRGLTLAELSAATGVSESTLSRLESGHRRGTLALLLPLPAATTSPWTTSSVPRAPAIPGSI